VLSESPSWLRFFWETSLPVTYPEKKVMSKFDDFFVRLKKEVCDSLAHTVILSDEGLISLPSQGVFALKNSCLVSLKAMKSAWFVLFENRFLFLHQDASNSYLKGISIRLPLKVLLKEKK